MENYREVLRGLIWALKQLQPLIPDGANWDNRAQSIANYRERAEQMEVQMATQKFPYTATDPNTGISFTPTRFDFDNGMLWRQNGQASGNGEWLPITGFVLAKNPFFNLLP